MRWLRELILLLPIPLAIYYTMSFSVPAPITDEWQLTNNAMIAHNMGWKHPLDTARAMRWRGRDHPLITTTIVYLIVGPRVHYDARVFIMITLGCYGVWLWVFRTRIADSPWTALPVALLLFTPSHWMEMVWGFQFGTSLSLMLPIVALAVMDTLPELANWRAFGWRLVAALALISAGSLAVAGGLFGFPALIVMMVVRRLSWMMKSVTIVAAAALFLLINYTSRTAPTPWQYTPRVFNTIMIGIGGTITGLPGGTFDFPFELPAFLGLVFCLIMLTSIAVAIYQRVLPILSLPLGLFVIGFLSAVGVSGTRPYIGNWHLEMILPAVVGAYGSVVMLARVVPGPRIQAFFGFAAGLVCLVLSAHGQAWKYGADHRSYAMSVNTYMKEYLIHPDAKKPYPIPPQDFDADLARFLQKKHYNKFKNWPNN
jgi:hypothetical protein